MYEEHELSEAVDLCDARGRLALEAVGVARRSLVRANLSGRWLRKKRWNFWNWIAPDFVFSVTLPDIGYASFCAWTLTEFRNGSHWKGGAYGRSGRLALLEVVDASGGFRGGAMEYENRVAGTGPRPHRSSCNVEKSPRWSSRRS